MASSKYAVASERAVARALEEFEKSSPKIYCQLMENRHHKDRTRLRAMALVEEDIRHAEQLLGKTEQDEITTTLSSILLPTELELVKTGFEFETYEMDIFPEVSSGPLLSVRDSSLRVSRCGENVFPEMMLSTQDDIDWAVWIQRMSLMIECTMFVCSVAGIKAKINAKRLAEMSEELAPKLARMPEAVQAFRRFQKKWSQKNVSTYEQAKAMFGLLTDAYDSGILQVIVKAIFENMNWYDYAEFVIVTTALFVAAFATQGIALIAKIALVLSDAFNIAKKVANLNRLDEN